MGTPTYTPLANITLSSSAASVTFSSISQAYRDLVIVMTSVSTGSAVYGDFRINGDSTAGNYNYVSMKGDGTSATSATATNSNSVSCIVRALTTGNSANWQMHIMDYSATDKHKTILTRGNSDTDATASTAVRWLNTAAVTSLIWPFTMPAGTSIALYGIAA